MQPPYEESIDGLSHLPTSPAALHTPISEIMTRDVVCVGPEATVNDLIEVFLVKAISGVPVVDASGRPLGVASKTDVLSSLAMGGRTVPVKNVMSPVTLAMPANSSIARAAAMMSYERVHRVVVVGPSGTIVGLVSAIDVLRWLAKSDGYAIP
jgi:predicted transcriptional regulator